MVHSFFYYPKKGGSQFIADRIASDLDINHETVFSIERSGQGIVINDVHYFTHVVFTGDVRRLPCLLGPKMLHQLPSNTLIGDLGNLAANATTTMLCECDSNDYSWIYIPHESIKPHRIIMTGNFSPHNNSQALPSHRSTCTVEYSGQMDKVDMEDEIKRLPFSMNPVSYNYCDASYVIHDHGTQELIHNLSSSLEGLGIYLCGRLAEWRYYNMDAAIESAMIVATKIIDIQAGSRSNR
jgi:hypothetical protein